MDEIRTTLVGIAGILNRGGIRFHITGGLAASFYGEPRFTQDVDIVVGISSESGNIDRLVSVLAPERYLFDAETATEEVALSGMFSALDLVTLIKVDLHIGEGVPGELSRSVLTEIFPHVALPLVSHEDAILSKLLWIQKGSHKSRKDVAMLLRSPRPIDLEYIKQGAAVLGVAELLDELHEEQFVWIDL